LFDALEMMPFFHLPLRAFPEKRRQKMLFRLTSKFLIKVAMLQNLGRDEADSVQDRKTSVFHCPSYNWNLHGPNWFQQRQNRCRPTSPTFPCML